ncbi:unnamed protein product, partial [Urochloa humidicola]
HHVGVHAAALPDGAALPDSAAGPARRRDPDLPLAPSLPGATASNKARPPHLPPRPPLAVAHHHHHQQSRSFQPPARTTTTNLESRRSTHCAARMDDYMDALNATSVGISEEALLDEAQGVGRADSSMSGSAAPPLVPRKVLTTRIVLGSYYYPMSVFCNNECLM